MKTYRIVCHDYPVPRRVEGTRKIKDVSNKIVSVLTKIKPVP